jgi:hypothetical protein
LRVCLFISLFLNIINDFIYIYIYICKYDLFDLFFYLNLNFLNYKNILKINSLYIYLYIFLNKNIDGKQNNIFKIIITVAVKNAFNLKIY